MDKKNIVQLLSYLGKEKYIDKDQWVMASCPFSPWLHEHGADTRPSFGIKKASYSGFHCFACGIHGSLYSLPDVWRYKTNTDLSPEIIEHIVKNEGKWKEEDSVPKSLLAIPSRVLTEFFEPPKLVGCINAVSNMDWSLRYDPIEERMVIPIFDKHQRLVGIRGRSLEEEPSLKFRMYNEFNPDSADPKGSGVWLGMQFNLKPYKALVLVEGDRDAILLKQVGVANVWASLGASVSRAQLDTLRNVPNQLILFFDNDKAGLEATKRVYDACHGLMPIKIIRNYYGVKDPAEAVEKGIAKKLFS